ncbi:putative F-box protein At2g02030 [Oryza sativa Japonica Group]|uniref:putative F-box protein At2g02030 n=1 Tax=Oryza sativa subsp. japonica TaxID=39947 RepID=UPI0001C7EAB9|nr:F-box protein interaction domain-containing protein [Oryza sativa Japonica Group]
MEIFIRLPAKTLARFKSVCKAWHTIISEPFFIRSHLRHSAFKHKQEPSFFVILHALDNVVEITFSNNVPVFRWKDGQGNACLVHAMDFHGEYQIINKMSHCDGLVLFPTDTKLYVINLTTSDVLRLPDNQESDTLRQATGLGLDPRTNMYKVARYFYRSVDHTIGTYDAAMEVFSIGQDAFWRETSEVPPYPVRSMESPIHSKGYLFWNIDERFLKGQSRGFLCFSLEDETFSLIPHPCPYLPLNHGTSLVSELDGELCVGLFISGQQQLWMYNGNQWDQRFSINVPGPNDLYIPLDILPHDQLLLQRGPHLYHHNHQSSEDIKEVARMDQLNYQSPPGEPYVYMENGYQLLFLSAIIQAYLTKNFLFNLKQDGKVLPNGPVVISPDVYFLHCTRKVASSLQYLHILDDDILHYYPLAKTPKSGGDRLYEEHHMSLRLHVWRDTDKLSYKKMGIPKGKIFIINPKVSLSFFPSCRRLQFLELLEDAISKC